MRWNPNNNNQLLCALAQSGEVLLYDLGGDLDKVGNGAAAAHLQGRRLDNLSAALCRRLRLGVLHQRRANQPGACARPGEAGDELGRVRVER